MDDGWEGDVKAGKRPSRQGRDGQMAGDDGRPSDLATDDVTQQKSICDGDGPPSPLLNIDAVNSASTSPAPAPHPRIPTDVGIAASLCKSRDRLRYLMHE